jgi:uncharacterized lipoprotein YbaY
MQNMKRMFNPLAAAALALTLSACASWWGPSGPTLLQGQVRLNGNPPAEVVAVEVRLIDRGEPRMPVTLAEQTLVHPRSLPVTFSLPVIDARRLPANGVYVLEARLYDSQGERARTQEDVRWQPGDQQAVELLLTAKPR